MKTEKLQQIILNIYTELYEHSEPKGDFKSLMKNAEINELGQKIIPFNDYTIDYKTSEDIIKKHSKGLSKYHKAQIRFQVMLGVSPKYKNVI